MQNKSVIFGRALRFILLCSLLPSALFSVPIDLSQLDSPVTIPISSENSETISFEICNFSENTLYVLQFQGDIKQLICSHPHVTFGANHTLLIEHESALVNSDVTVLADLSIGNTSSAVTVKKIAIPTDTYPHLPDSIWHEFIDQIKDRVEPREVTARLVEITRHAPLKRVLAIGCESGEDPLYFAAHGSDVTILDATPHAIAITCLRMASHNYLAQLKEALVCNVENTPDTLETFDAVTGGQVFSFIAPDQFTDVMSTKVLSKVAPNGYFSGYFLGHEHAWADHPGMTFLDARDLLALFEGNGFEIVEMNEVKSIMQTVLDGKVRWHEFQIIAKRVTRDE